MLSSVENPTFEVLHETGPYDTLAEDVLAGFDRSPRELPPKYFYDERGGRLFDEITRLEEYYPTRIETELLRRFAAEIATAGRFEELLEIGPGSPVKALLLLPDLVAHDLASYAPFDINRAAIEGSARTLLARWPELRIHGAIGDFTCHFEEIPRRGRRLIAFLGGTIGNFSPAERADFLARVHASLGPDDRFLLGTDLRPGRVKTRARLELAYDDPAGVTAEFNRNLLRILNRELGADFVPNAFRHRAPYDPELHRIEMHLVASRDMTVAIPRLGRSYEFAEGDSIRTELSHKFDRAQVEELFEASGLELVRWMTDDDELFALSLARRP